VTNLVGDLISRGRPEDLDHPLLKEPTDLKRDVLLVLTSNRGLCGGYNMSVLQMAMERYAQVVRTGYEIRLHVSGKRGVQFCRMRRLDMERTFTQYDYLPKYREIGLLAHEYMDDFLSGRISGLEVAYMQYLSAGRQQPAIAQILPLSYIEPPKSWVAYAENIPYEVMPSSKEILRNLLPATARLRLWQCFLDAGVSEQFMRIAAMRAASDNGEEMIHDLTIEYNRTRQSQITSELAEIMGGRAALE
jgi:F-type H+-transporting ATPase subunit gamma